MEGCGDAPLVRVDVSKLDTSVQAEHDGVVSRCPVSSTFLVDKCRELSLFEGSSGKILTNCLDGFAQWSTIA